MSTQETKGKGKGKAELPPLKNTLEQARSPYLLQHKSNPVHWQQWTPETIARAREEDKMIFLSVGYSTCHWCGVQAEESFSNETCAAMMNKYFICIKVDREERPDVDRMYMQYLQATSGGGGWPMSVFLTPTLEPVFAGTYFPLGKFMGLLDKISELWQDQREMVIENGRDVIQQLKDVQVSDDSESSTNLAGLINPAVHKIYKYLCRNYDPVNGGFSRRGPKFPSTSQNMVILARIAAHSAKKDASEESQQEGRNAAIMGMDMLRALWEGGVRDWVGGGVARYSVDEYFRLPHFEKMLYDQAQLALSALEFALLPNLPAPQEENRRICEDLAADIIDYVSRNLVSADGGMFNAEDADSGESLENPGKKSEGAFYVWTREEFDLVLGDDAEVAATFWNVKAKGNVDPSHDARNELKGKNTLYQTLSYAEVAKKHGTSEDQVRDIIQRSIVRLREWREQNRPKPHLDDKIMVSWNGLMINALAQASASLPSERYTVAGRCRQLAERAVQFIRSDMYDETTGTLVRSWREGKGPTAQADDYAFLIQALIRMYSITGQEIHLLWAIQLQEKMDELFEDKQGGGYWASEEDELVLVRMKESQDGAEPAALSVAVHNLFALAHYCSDRYRDYRDKAERVLKSNEAMLKQAPFVFATAVAGGDDAVRGMQEYVITGASDSTFVRAMIQTLHATRYIPNKVVIYIDPSNPPTGLAHYNAVVKDIVEGIERDRSAGRDIKENLRICRDFACGLPIFDVEQAKKEILA